MEIEKSSTVTKDNFPAAEYNSTRPNKSAETKVEVAVRVRPFISKEILNRDEKCVQTFRETNQVCHMLIIQAALLVLYQTFYDVVLSGIFMFLNGYIRSVITWFSPSPSYLYYVDLNGKRQNI